jgi:serine/threonine-protein kinase
MAPEQLRGERVDFRAALFAVGAVLYELLAGAAPFAPPHPEEQDAEPSQLLRIENGAFRPLRRAASGVPRALARIVHRCLRANPRRRIATAVELRMRLERHVGVAAPADTRREIAEWLEDRKLLPARGRTRRSERSDEDVAPAGRARLRVALRLALVAAVAGLLAALAIAGPELTPRVAEWAARSSDTVVRVVDPPTGAIPPNSR